MMFSLILLKADANRICFLHIQLNIQPKMIGWIFSPETEKDRLNEGFAKKQED